MPLMFVTLDVLNVSGKVSDTRDEQERNISLMFVTLDVLNVSGKVSDTRDEQ